MKPHLHDCDCVRCENLRHDGLPTDGRCLECGAPYNTAHFDGCSRQTREDYVGQSGEDPPADEPAVEENPSDRHV